MSSRLTIVQVLPQLNTGGVERGTLEVNRALVAEGHRSIVISGGGRLVGQLEVEGGEHVEMAVWKKSPFTLATVPRLRRWMQKVNPDVMHVRSRVPAWVTWLAWKTMPAENRPRFLTTAHGLNRPNAYSRIMTYGERVIAVSKTCRDYLLESYPEMDPGKVIVIHRGVASSEFPFGYAAPTAWLDEWYSQYPQLKNQFVACVSGRVTRLKGHFDFLDALHQLRNDGVTIYGVIAGGEDPRRSTYSTELRERISELNLQDQIVLTGHRTDIKDIISASDVIVSTTYKPPESFGRAVLEALRLGKITLGYDHGGVGEVLATAFPAGLVPVRDVAALAERLKAASTGDITPPRDGQWFQLETMLESTLRVYQELTEKPR